MRQHGGGGNAAVTAVGKQHAQPRAFLFDRELDRGARQVPVVPAELKEMPVAVVVRAVTGVEEQDGIVPIAGQIAEGGQDPVCADLAPEIVVTARSGKAWRLRFSSNSPSRCCPSNLTYVPMFSSRSSYAITAYSRPAAWTGVTPRQPRATSIQAHTHKHGGVT